MVGELRFADGKKILAQPEKDGKNTDGKRRFFLR